MPRPQPERIYGMRELTRILTLTPKRAAQLRRLELLHGDAGYTFRDLLALRAASALLDTGASVRQIKQALAALRRQDPGLEQPLAELRLVLEGDRLLAQSDRARFDPRSGQLVLALDSRGLEAAATATLATGLVRPLAPPVVQAETWFERASEWDGDPAQWEDAIEAYRRVVAIDPTYAAAWNNLGLLLHRLGSYDEAEAAYRSALEHDPRCCEAAYNLGSLHEDRGAIEDAIGDYRQALELRPDYARPPRARRAAGTPRMKVLVIGGGGREHALAWKLAQSPQVHALLAAPGNPGIARHATCVPVAADAVEDLVALARRERIDLTLVGPEAPLVAGLADRLGEAGLTVFGPGARAAALEGSKAFAKELMARHGIPTARFAIFDDPARARRHCRATGAPLVVKADGLAAGKGALVCKTLDEALEAVAQCMERRAFGAAGARVVVEEYLAGEEVSFFALSNGREALPLAAAQDHKPVFDDDRGPNTGGMGAYSPVACFDAALEERVMDTIVTPTLAALAKEGAPYRGVLYVGLMLTSDGPKVVEFNCRFGDPECQALMLRAPDDLLALLLAAARGEAWPAAAPWAPRASVSVTLASGGYPGRYATGLPIAGIEAAEARPGVRVFQAGTALSDGRLVTAGGRVLSVTALADDLAAAIAAAYTAVREIRFEGMHYRTDIGRRPAGRVEGGTP